MSVAQTWVSQRLRDNRNTNVQHGLSKSQLETRANVETTST